MFGNSFPELELFVSYVCVLFVTFLLGNLC